MVNEYALDNDNDDDGKVVAVSGKSKEKEQIIKSLIDEYKENREALKGYIKDLEQLKEKIDSIFPSNLDARYMRFFEEKIKAATQLFSAILQMRVEISRGLKTEIDLRKNLIFDDEESGNLISATDIRQMAEQVEKFQKQFEKKNVIDINQKREE